MKLCLISCFLSMNDLHVGTRMRIKVTMKFLLLLGEEQLQVAVLGAIREEVRGQICVKYSSPDWRLW